MTYSVISLTVTFGVLVVGALGFLGGWLAHRALSREHAPTDRSTIEHYYDD